MLQDMHIVHKTQPVSRKHFRDREILCLESVHVLHSVCLDPSSVIWIPRKYNHTYEQRSFLIIIFLCFDPLDICFLITKVHIFRGEIRDISG